MSGETTDNSGTGPKGDDEPGWGLPSIEPAPTPVASPSSDAQPGADDAPLTPIQQAVVSEVAQGQRALGRQMRWARRSGWERPSLLSVVDSGLSAGAAREVSESERAAEFLVGPPKPGSDVILHVPAGGPPTPEEVHEAEMNPWPHHGMAETIERNRRLRSATGDDGASTTGMEATAPPD